MVSKVSQSDQCIPLSSLLKLSPKKMIIMIIIIIMLFPLHSDDINVSLFACCFGEKIILKPFLQMENMCTLSKKLLIFTNVLGINLI